MLKKYEDSNSNQQQDNSQNEHSENDDSSSYSNEEANQTPVPLQEDVDFYQKHGMFFCGVCNNLMQPNGTKAQLLEFRCRRCGIKNINFKNRVGDKCLIYSKSLQQNSKRVQNDAKLMLDSSMPRMIVECPECSYHEAVYMMAPEEGQRRIVLKMICARGAEQKVMKCGKTWDLEQDTEIEQHLCDGILSLKDA